VHSQNEISSDYVCPEACLCPRILPHLTTDSKDGNGKLFLIFSI
jgi:hypothetical protein